MFIYNKMYEIKLCFIFIKKKVQRENFMKALVFRIQNYEKKKNSIYTQSKKKNLIEKTCCLYLSQCYRPVLKEN